jgi:polar amino acid transport system substrate-binding protein
VVGPPRAIENGPVASGGAAKPIDLRMTTLDDPRKIPENLEVVPLGYRAAPMAIMRTDSSIRRWEQLRGRTACVAEGGNYVGDLEARYGAVEIVHPSPADALLALRTGGCDVMVHDSPMLEELIRLPEWKKFSRRLPPRPSSTLALLVPSTDSQAVSRVQDVVEEWKANAFAQALVKNAVRNIAFEVYLDQEVPDCH